MFLLWGSFQVCLQTHANVCMLMCSQKWPSPFLGINTLPYLSNLAREWVTWSSRLRGRGFSHIIHHVGPQVTSCSWDVSLSEAPPTVLETFAPQLSSSNPRCQFYLSTPVQLVPSGAVGLKQGPTGVFLWVPTVHIWFEAQLDWIGVFWKRTWD